MKARCCSSKKDGYHRYGGRGIKVCVEWLNDFEAFKSWALANGFKKELQIDRINSDGDYSPENCRFVTPEENTRNQDQVKLSVEEVKAIKKLLGEGSLSQKEIAKQYGVCRATITAINTGARWNHV